MDISRYTQSTVWVFLVWMTFCSPNVAWEVEPPAQGKAVTISIVRKTFGEVTDRIDVIRDDMALVIYNRSMSNATHHLPGNYFYPLHLRGDRSPYVVKNTYRQWDSSTDPNVLQVKEILLCNTNVYFENANKLLRNEFVQDYSGLKNEFTMDLLYTSDGPEIYVIVTYKKLALAAVSFIKAGSVFYTNGQKTYAVERSFENIFTDILLTSGNARDEKTWIYALNSDELKYTWNGNQTEVKVNGTVIADNSTHDVLLGDTFEPSCGVREFPYPILNVTLSCGSYVQVATESVNAVLSLSVNAVLSLSVNSSFGGVACKCTAMSAVSGCGFGSASFTLKIIHGPTKVQIGTKQKQPSICDDIIPTVVMFCEIDKTDVYPVPSVIIQGLPGGDLNLDYYVSLQEVYRFNFTFTPLTPGAKNLTCVASSVAGDFKAEQTSTVLVKEPPMSPIVNIKNGPVLINGTVHNTRIGSLDIECTVEGGIPAFSDITLKCDDITNTTVEGTVVTLNLKIEISPINMECICFADHESGCDINATHFTISPVYGPTSVGVGPPDIRPFDLCEGENTYVSVYCDVNNNEVKPSSEVVLHGEFDNDLEPYDVKPAGNLMRHHFQFRPTSGGVCTAKCMARNSHFNDITQEYEFTYYVYEPPTTTPKITVDGQIITEGKIVNATLGTTVEVVCRAEGGYPNVTKVVIECDGETNDSEGTESAMTLQIQRATHQAVCKCHADHISGCYQKTTQFSIDVWEPASITSYTLNSKSESAQITAGSNLEFLCQAEGIPTPSFSIKGLITGNIIQGNIKTMNHYTSKMELTKPMACNESDSYVCTSDNGITSQSSWDVLIKCPPQMFVDPTRNQIHDYKFKVGPDGLAQAEFDIISRPRPLRYTLMKKIRSEGRKRRETTGDEVEMDQNDYNVTFKDININRGHIYMYFMDIDIDDQNGYTLRVDNGVGDGLPIELTTVLVKGSTNFGGENPYNIIGLSIVSIVASLIIIIIAVFVGCYIACTKQVTKKVIRN